ncbi:heme-degrading domain-containing protein [Leeia oryzae]|uniref:heme-degrading domain-containing protein n=1 Tax=Leeia oryzae TaxID=356662 RepID=UPI00036BCE59|nr:heme-degrading domain-containing protein [Leeia oryzae]
MTIEQDLAIIAEQEEALVFKQFDASIAWQIGSQLREEATLAQLPVVIDIWLGDQCLFHAALPGAAVANAEWARRKRNVVRLMNKSSYAVGLGYQLSGGSIFEKMGVPVADYATHGGAFPVRIHNSSCIGTITISGLPQRQDHQFVVDQLAIYLERDVPVLPD